MVNKEYDIYSSSAKTKAIPVDRGEIAVKNKRQFEISEFYPNPVDINYASVVAPKTSVLTSGYHAAPSSRNSHNLRCDTEAEMSQIGRFKYILQMDREMVANSAEAAAYRLTPQHNHQQLAIVSEVSETSKRNSDTSDNLRFWKSRESQLLSESRCERGFRAVAKVWHVVKWPLMLLLICGILGLVIHFLVLEKEIGKSLESQENIFELKEQRNLDFLLLNKTEDLPSTPTEILRNNLGHDTPETDPNFNSIEEILEILINAPNKTEYSIVESSDGKIIKSTTPTTTKNQANPTKDSRLEYGFTSGHQNNFGIPIEEDERILKFLNDELIRIQNGTTTPRLVSTTDSEDYRTKVSPTLPLIRKMEISTEKLNIPQDDVTCVSTSLACKGVSHYDLTVNVSIELTSLELSHFKTLVDSQCSARVPQFLCSIKEPECRPMVMGILPPCRRFCKAILEPCSNVVAGSELLTSLFDCNIYPDSSDPKICNDPTRFSKCLKNEFKCSDSTCIPQQWKCDNIKDCASGNDEENCKFCERDEFRCLSNEKCIPDKWRCDQYKDCPDGSDEVDCIEDDSRSFPLAYGNARVYPVVYEQDPSDPKSRPYLKRTTDDRAIDQDKSASEGTLSRPSTIFTTNLANFQDSTEIMMTSDSEADYKYAGNKISSMTTSHSSPCPNGELMCISGRCISVLQLCDKVPDCPDGADEAMCIYEKTIKP